VLVKLGSHFGATTYKDRPEGQANVHAFNKHINKTFTYPYKTIYETGLNKLHTGSPDFNKNNNEKSVILQVFIIMATNIS